MKKKLDTKVASKIFDGKTISSVSIRDYGIKISFKNKENICIRRDYGSGEVLLVEHKKTAEDKYRLVQNLDSKIGNEIFVNKTIDKEESKQAPCSALRRCG